MTIEDFEIQDGTSNIVAESKIQLQKLLDCGEFSQEDYDTQMEELNLFDDNLMCAWGNRIDWSDKFLDNAGMIYYEATTGEVVDFIGYC